MKRIFLPGLLLFCFVIWGNLSQAATLRVVNFGGDLPGITSLDQSFDPDSYSVITQIFDSLVHVDLDGKKVPALALSWDLVDNTTYHFKLRPGVKFHNGEDFNAQAVKFTYDQVLDPATKAGNAWILNTIKEVKVLAPDQVEIKLKHPDGMFLYRLSMFGSIAPPGYIAKVGLKGFMAKPVGTGPYMFDGWDKGKEIRLKKNPNYWMKGVPHYDELVFKILPESQWVDALSKGEVDVITNVDPASLAGVEKNPNLKTVKRLVLQGYWVLLSNQGQLADVRVRQALNHAVDKTNLIKVQAAGLGKPLASLGKAGELGQNKDLAPYAFDPGKAKALLGQAGKAGLKLKALSINAAKPLSEAIKADLAKVGVSLEVEYVSRPEWAKRVIVGKITGNPYQGDMVINLVDNPVVDLAFHAGLFLHSASPWSLTKDEAFDKKFLWALFRADLNAHVEALHQLDQYIHDQAMLLFTFQPVRVFAMNRKVQIGKIGVNGHVDYDVFTQAK